MIDDGFYFFDKGSFGELRGYKRIAISQAEQQSILDNNARERLNMFNPPPGLSPAEYSGMFMTEFLKARAETQDEVRVVPFTVTVQVGNLESLKEIEKIENHLLFSHWEQPEFVKRFKKISDK